MKYALAIHKDKDSCYGVTIPDIPGCFSSGETIDEALDNAKEAAEMHFETLGEDGQDIPLATSVESHVANKEFKDAIWYVVDLDPYKFMGKAKRINITAPELALTKIDNFLKSNSTKFKDRSSFLVESALEVVEKETA